MRKRYLLRGSLLLLILIVPVLIDPGSQAMAQACTSELAEADQAYTLGNFDEAINMLSRCLDKSNATSPERQQAYRLVALSYLGKGDSRRARAQVQALLRINPTYQPDADQDPPPFVQMVRAAKREAPPAPEPEVPEGEDGGGIAKLLLIGGGVALAALAAVLLADRGEEEGGSNEVLEPTTINEQEPNNGPTQAQVLRGNPPITIHGNVEVDDHSEIGFTHQDGSFDDFEDWYQFTIAAPGIRINLSGLSSDCDLFLLRPNPLSIPLGGFSGNDGTQPELINLPTLAAGTYLIVVTIFDPDPQGPASSPYRLVVNGAVSGSNLRLAREQIQRYGGAEVSDHFRLVAHDGVGASLPAALPEVTAWTAYHDDGGTLVEYDATETFRFEPGRGFWVQSAEPFAAKATTTPAAPGEAYTIPLEKGWNIIANPSEAPLDWTAVQAVNGITQGLWRWDGYFAPTDTFEPARGGEAYYFMNATGLEALTIPRRSVARTGRSARRGLRSVLTLSVYREGRRASVVRAGFEEDAAPGLDGYDQYAPPGFFEAASLRLVRQISSESRVELASEFRPWGDAGQRFELMLKTPAHAPVELRVEGLEAFAGYHVYLIDPEKTLAYDLHAQPVLTLTSSQALRRFTLVVGDETFAQAARAELAPETISLSNYPNPFNPHTRISYTVPDAEEPVRLDIYDVAGRLVRVLVDGLQKPGLHHVEWDGADASGMPVASGVYLYRLQTGRHLQVRRMLLMK